MYAILPMTVTDTELTASSVAENDHSEYDISTTYAANDRVISTTTHRIYQSVQGSNLGNALTDAAWWTDVGATNRWRPFDGVLQDTCGDSGPITFTVAPGANVVTAIALLNLTATEATVTITASGAGSPFYDETQTYSAGETSAVFSGFATASGDTIVISIGASLEDAELGEIVLGQLFYIGSSVSGTEIGITDYSIKDQDAFGNYIVTQRAFTDTPSFEAMIRTDRAASIKQMLADRRALPTVFMAEDTTDWSATLVYGYFTNLQIDMAPGDWTFSRLTMDVEGLA